MKTVKELNNRKVPIVSIDHSLDKYKDNTPFPDKLAMVNQMLKTVRLPAKKRRS